MNTNPTPEAPEHGGEALGSPIEIGADSARVVQQVLSELSDPAARQRILAGYLESGPAFAAYLLLKDTAPDHPDLASQFAESYVSSWELVDQLIDDTLEGLGWTQALREFCSTQGIDPDYLAWDRDLLEGHIRETYDIIELDGWQHVFHT